MSTEMMTLEVPARLYANLATLAAEEQTDVVATLARLVMEASDQKTSSPRRMLRQLLEQASAQPATPALIAEMMWRSLHISPEQWERLRQNIPSTVELSQIVGQSLGPDAQLSAEIAAMREA